MHKNKELSIPLAIIAAGAMIAVAVFFSGSAGGPGLGNGAPAGNRGTTPTGKVEPVSSKDHVFGNPDAKVTVVEYSDLECPFCKVFHATMHQVVANYGDKVNWVYRHFPIAQLHPKAAKEAEASECAFDQGGNTAFWNYIDELFATTQSNNKLDEAELPRIAGKIGLDVTKFNECLSSGVHTDEIADAVAAANKAGAQGTPYSVIIAGKTQIVINGAEPYESVKAKIDSVLQ